MTSMVAGGTFYFVSIFTIVYGIITFAYFDIFASSKDFAFENLMLSYLYFEVRSFPTDDSLRDPYQALVTWGRRTRRRRYADANWVSECFPTSQTTHSNIQYRVCEIVWVSRRPSVAYWNFLERESCLTSQLSRYFTMPKRTSVGSNSVLFKQSSSIILDLSGVSGGGSWRYKARYDIPSGPFCLLFFLGYHVMSNPNPN
jgi:hypothetical protein